MSDSQQHADTQDAGQDASVPAGPTAGTLLREAREAAGLHIAALAVSLKVPVRKLEALEADRLDLLPDAVFVRALASSVCRTLKMDPAPVLDRLPQTAAPRLVRDAGGINTPFRAPSDGRGPSWVDQLSKPVFLAVFALLLAALVLIFLPSARQDDAAATLKPEAAGAAVAVPVSPAASPDPAPAVPASTAPTPTPPPAAQPTVVVSAPGATPAPAVSPTFSVAVSTPTVVSPTAVVTAPPLPTTGIVVFKTQGESWVEVTDAKGVIAVRKTLAAGEVVGASGALPLSVVIGRANATRVEVRGRPFDLGTIAKDNVARFEVK
ncbi:MAG: helix-turn-helix domain-containing protein [Ramlibacter sp.]